MERRYIKKTVTKVSAKTAIKIVANPSATPPAKTVTNNANTRYSAYYRQPYVDLVRLFIQDYHFNLKRCPRCGGPIFWYYLHCDPYGRGDAKNKMKCFCCGRYFVLVAKNSRSNGTCVWKQYPDRDEEYAVVEEKLPAKK